MQDTAMSQALFPPLSLLKTKQLKDKAWEHTYSAEYWNVWSE